MKHLIRKATWGKPRYVEWIIPSSINMKYSWPYQYQYQGFTYMSIQHWWKPTCGNQLLMGFQWIVHWWVLGHIIPFCLGIQEVQETSNIFKNNAKFFFSKFHWYFHHWFALTDINGPLCHWPNYFKLSHKVIHQILFWLKWD